MRRLSLFNRILYLNPEPISFKNIILGRSKFRKIYRRFNRNLFILPQGITVLGRYSKIVDKIANVIWKLFLQLFAALKLSKRRILWLYPPESYKWLGLFCEQMSVYDCVDDYSKFPAYRNSFAKKRIKVLERLLSKRVDVIITTSEKMFNEKRRFNQNTYLIGNVADFEHFHSSNNLNYKEPAEIRTLPHPRFLFFGALSSFKLNFKLLTKLASEIPGGSVILIGPTRTGELFTDLTELKAFPNIHVLGGKDYNKLPAFIKYSDVLILPYRYNEYIESCFPIKFFEYLSTGKPVITTAIPELKVFRETVPEADTEDDFINLSKEIINNPPSPEKIENMINLAKENTWVSRITRITEEVNRLGGKIKYPTMTILKKRRRVSIGIDARLMNYTRMGIGEYVENLIIGLAELDLFNNYYLYFDSEPKSLNLPPNFKVRILPRRNAIRWLNISLSKACECDGISVLHSPVNFEMPLTGKFKKLVTIHDLVPIAHPRFATKRFAFFARNLYPFVIREADLIITDSINSMEDILKFYSASKRKVKVIYPGIKPAFSKQVSESEKQEVLEKYSITRGYILNTGGFEPRKNILNLIKGYEMFLNSNPEQFLVIPGKKSHTYSACEAYVKERGLDSKVIFPDFVC
ncbi:MAG TPA: glycosyltransferase, partial [Firmicutes bacterium]|nr:glycosyltransferase [Bacillota bacterium]